MEIKIGEIIGKLRRENRYCNMIEQLDKVAATKKECGIWI